MPDSSVATLSASAADVTTLAGELDRIETLSVSEIIDLKRRVFVHPGLRRRVGEVEAALGETKENPRRRALISWVNGHSAEAVELFETVNPQSAAHLYAYGAALRDVRRFTRSLEALAAAEQKAPDDQQVAVVVEKVESLLALSRVEEAEKALKALSAGAAAHPDVRCLTTCVQEFSGRAEEAIKEYESILKAHPHNVRTLFRLAALYDRVGEEDLALRMMERAVRVPPSNVGVFVNLGLMYEDRDRWDQARRCYQLVLADNPAHDRARMYLKDAENSTVQVIDEEQVGKEDKMVRLLGTPVTDFELSVRSRNCLDRMNIRSLGDLITRTEQELLAFKNFGETSLAEIKNILAAKGLRLGQKIEEGIVLPAEPVVVTPEGIDQSTAQKPIAELNFSVRARRCMDRLGVKTIGDLVNRSEPELLATRNFGTTSLNEVKEKLRGIGLTLRDA